MLPDIKNWKQKSATIAKNGVGLNKQSQNVA